MGYTSLPYAALVTEVFTPVVRADGFKGSGGKFRRVDGDLIHVMSLQTHRTGGSLALNLGVHPLGVADTVGQPPDPSKLDPSSCDFFRRLAASATDQWWQYEASEDSLRSALSRAAGVYATAGRRLFAGFSGTGTPFHTVTPEQVAGGGDWFSGFASHTTLVRQAYLLARFRRFLRREDEARAFARLALAHLKSASLLRAPLEAMLADQPGPMADSGDRR